MFAISVVEISEKLSKPSNIHRWIDEDLLRKVKKTLLIYVEMFRVVGRCTAKHCLKELTIWKVTVAGTVFPHNGGRKAFSGLGVCISVFDTYLDYRCILIIYFSHTYVCWHLIMFECTIYPKPELEKCYGLKGIWIYMFLGIIHQTWKVGGGLNWRQVETGATIIY